MSVEFLGFEIGGFHESGTDGAPPTALLGTVKMMPDGRRLRVVKNSDQSALTKNDALELKGTNWSVQRVSADAVKKLAGVVPREYPNAGETIPKGALFYVTEDGIEACIANVTTIADGDAIYTDAAASAGARGRVRDAGAASAIEGALMGVAVEAELSVGNTVLVRLRI